MIVLEIILIVWLIFEIGLYASFFLCIMIKDEFPKGNFDEIETKKGLVLWSLYAFLPIKSFVLIVIGVNYCYKRFSDKLEEVNKYEKIVIEKQQKEIKQDGKLSIISKGGELSITGGKG